MIRVPYAAATQAPLTLAGVDVAAPAGVTNNDGNDYVVKYAPDGTVTLQLFLENTGRLPVRLDGINPPWVPTSDPDNQFIAAFYKAEPLSFDRDTAAPFHPVDVAPGQTVVADTVDLTPTLSAPFYKCGFDGKQP